MITTKTIQQNIEHVVSVTCDMCAKVYNETDFMELQEFHHINFTGGYQSVFGDGMKIESDICQHCLKEILKGHFRGTALW